MSKAIVTRVVLFNKPWGVLSQFTACDGHPGLAGYLDLPQFRVAGRLDRDSEGLLVLTNDGLLLQRITDPNSERWKTYLVQVEGVPDEKAIGRMRSGVDLRDGPTLPCRVRAVDAPAWLWPRDPPVRYRKSIPTTWIEVSLREGRNRQLRRMTAAVGFPTLRLVRRAVGYWVLGNLAPGQSIETTYARK